MLSHSGESEFDATNCTFRRAAISFAMAALSAGDNSRFARGKTKSSSILMCCVYIEIRLDLSTSIMKHLSIFWQWLSNQQTLRLTLPLYPAGCTH